MSKAMRLARIFNDLNQREAGARMGVSQQEYSKMERGVRVTPPEKLKLLIGELADLPPVDPEKEFLDDVAKPVDELRLEAEGIGRLVAAVVLEIRNGGDRDLLAAIADMAFARQRKILAAINAKVESLPGRAN